MTVNQLIAAGKLDEAAATLTAEIRARPTDPSLRVALFEILSLQGDLDRAAKQLSAISTDDVQQELAIQQYRDILTAESLRRRVFAGAGSPVLTDPPTYVAHYLDGLREASKGNFESAARSFAAGDEARAAVAGSWNGVPFEDFRDADDRTGPFLELYFAAEYRWVPWESIRGISLSEPKHTRNLLWAPASVLLHSGESLVGFAPALYCGSHLGTDDIRLGRATQWDETHGYAAGLGQRVLFAGDEQPPFLDLREIEFVNPNEEQSIEEEQESE